MRMLGAANIGNGTLLSAHYDGEYTAFVLKGGAIMACTPSAAPVTVDYGQNYCRTDSGIVKLKGEVPVYETK